MRIYMHSTDWLFYYSVLFQTFNGFCNIHKGICILFPVFILLSIIYLWFLFLLRISCLFSWFYSVFLRFPSFLPAFIPSFRPSSSSCFVFFIFFFIYFFASFTNIGTVLIEFYLSSCGCSVPFSAETWLSRLWFLVFSLVLARRCWYRTLN